MRKTRESRWARRELTALALGAATVVLGASCGTTSEPRRVGAQMPSRVSNGGETSSGGMQGATGGTNATTGGAAPSGGAAGTGGVKATTPTEPNLLVAFIGDQGNGAAADKVLELIKGEGAAATVHNGDFDYESNPSAWDDRVTRILGASYPYFAIVGNHDAPAWNGVDGYAAKIAARTARVPEMSCNGELGVKASCSFRGLALIESCIGVGELRPSCGKDSAEQVAFLRDALGSSTALWKICGWHKNQEDFQVGTKSDEVGYLAYQECMHAGAIVATGHEHSYSRTRTLSRIGLPLSGHGAAGPYDALRIAPGQTFLFVTGLGGASIRPFDHALHDDDRWWASYYTSDAWLMNGTPQTGAGAFGALFVRFGVDDDPKKAKAYFKDVNGRVADSFTIQRQ